jgi:DNA-directed RNA polymerase specialized sigma subunit
MVRKEATYCHICRSGLSKTPSEADSEPELIDDLLAGRFESKQLPEGYKLRLAEAIKQLRDGLREVIELTIYENLSRSEVAGRLGISGMQVSRRLRAATAALLKIITQSKKADMEADQVDKGLSDASEQTLANRITSHAQEGVAPINQLAEADEAAFRATVLNMIVRQAGLDGSWRELCAAVMQWQNISVAEVEAELIRRQSILSDTRQNTPNIAAPVSTKSKLNLKGDLADIGPLALLNSLNHDLLTGILSAEDKGKTFHLLMEKGEPIRASADQFLPAGRWTVKGSHALLEFLTDWTNGDYQFTPGGRSDLDEEFLVNDTYQKLRFKAALFSSVKTLSHPAVTNVQDLRLREMVLKAIVTEAAGGGPWQEACSDEMIENKITVDEVEAGVERRRKPFSRKGNWERPKEEDLADPRLHELASETFISKDRENELVARFARSGYDQAASYELDIANARVIYRVASDYAGRGIEFSELIKSGRTGLFAALRTCEVHHPESNFGLLAAWWIQREIAKAVEYENKSI